MKRVSQSTVHADVFPAGGCSGLPTPPAAGGRVLSSTLHLGSASATSKEACAPRLSRASRPSHPSLVRPLTLRSGNSLLSPSLSPSSSTRAADSLVSLSEVRLRHEWALELGWWKAALGHAWGLPQLVTLPWPTAVLPSAAPSFNSQAVRSRLYVTWHVIRSLVSLPTKLWSRFSVRHSKASAGEPIKTRSGWLASLATTPKSPETPSHSSLRI